MMILYNQINLYPKKTIPLFVFFPFFCCTPKKSSIIKSNPFEKFPLPAQVGVLMTALMTLALAPEDGSFHGWTIKDTLR